MRMFEREIPKGINAGPTNTKCTVRIDGNSSSVPDNQSRTFNVFESNGQALTAVTVNDSGIFGASYYITTGILSTPPIRIAPNGSGFQSFGGTPMVESHSVSIQHSAPLAPTS